MKNATKAIIVTAAVIIAIILLSNIIIVYEGEYACIQKFGKVVDVYSKPGVYLKTPFIENKIIFPKKKLLYDLQPSEVLTIDKKQMLVDNYVIWQIEDPLTFVKRVNYIPKAEKLIDQTAYNVIKNTLGKLEQSSIINEESSERGNLGEIITEETRQLLDSQGIKIWDVKIKRLDLPEDNEQAVYRRMISERDRISAQHIAEGKLEADKIKNEVDKNVRITISEAEQKAQEIIGEGEAEYMQIVAEAFSGEKQEFYEFTRSLEAYKKALKGKKTLIIPIDSPFAKYLTGYTE